MKIMLKNNDYGIITNYTINSTKKTSEFIEELYQNLKELKKNSYYCIWFKYENKYKKKIKAKLGYIYKDLKDYEHIILIADEEYINYYIEKMCLKCLDIEYTMGIGIPKKVKIRSIRNARGMGDDVHCDIQEMLEPEIKMCNILKLKNFYELSFILESITYTNLKNEKCIENAEKFAESNMTFSEYIQINSADTEKEILLTWTCIH